MGYYSPGYAVGSTLGMVAAPLVTLLPPVLSKHYDDNNIADVRTILTYSLKYYSGIALPCVFALSVLSKPLLLVLTTQQIAANGYLVTPLVAAGTALVGASTDVCYNTRIKKEDCHHWHDLDTQCCVEFRFKLSAYSLFRPRRCCTHHFPRILCSLSC